MLGKRCRTLHRTTSISQNMSPHYRHLPQHHYHDLPVNLHIPNLADQAVPHCPTPINPLQAPTMFPQIIGFTPIINTGCNHGSFNSQSNSVRTSPPDQYDDDPPCFDYLQQKPQQKQAGAPLTKRSQVSPRSALQTLLAASRQIAHIDQIANNFVNISEGESSPYLGSASPMKQGFFSPENRAVKPYHHVGKDITQTSSVLKGLTGLKPAPDACNIVNERESNQLVDVTDTAERGLLAVSVLVGATEDSMEGGYKTIDLPVGDQEQFSLEGVERQSYGTSHGALYLATSPLMCTESALNLAASMSFLESCNLCMLPLGQGRDIFIYRGETAFCSAECRDTQMRMDERKESLRRLRRVHNMNVQAIDNCNTAIGNAAHDHHHHSHRSGKAYYDNKESMLMPAA